MFFAVTKLFQNADMNLRRMVYLCLKDICPDAEEVMIVTNSLMKDMNAPQELYRANSIRVLRSIIDGAVLQQLERYFKQGIVDKAPVHLLCEAAWPPVAHMNLHVMCCELYLHTFSCRLLHPVHLWQACTCSV